MVKGVIFDIDGVIVDSEPLHMEALFELMKRELNFEVNIAENDLIGLTLDDTIAQFGISKNKTEKIKQLTIKYYLEKLSPDLIRPNVKKLWISLIEKDIKFGCVSSAEMQICEGNIKLLELNDKKQVPIVAFESVVQSKPHPLPYLAMLDMLALNADEVMVLEDSDTGILSAVSAGISNVYAWPHKLSYSQKYHQAKAVITTLYDVEFLSSVMG